MRGYETPLHAVVLATEADKSAEAVCVGQTAVMDGISVHGRERPSVCLQQHAHATSSAAQTCLDGHAMRYFTSRSIFCARKRSFFRTTPTPRWKNRTRSVCLHTWSETGDTTKGSRQGSDHSQSPSRPPLLPGHQTTQCFGMHTGRGRRALWSVARKSGTAFGCPYSPRRCPEACPT